MISPKEKAEKLADSFLTASFGTMEEYVPVPYEFAKQCALICANEMYDIAEQNDNVIQMNYLVDVRKELELL